MSCANFIADGYTQPGYILPVDRLHHALRFRFRPVLAEERSRLTDSTLTATAAGYLRQGAALLAEKLVDWNITDPRANDVEISPANVLRLQPEAAAEVAADRAGASWPATSRSPLAR